MSSRPEPLKMKTKGKYGSVTEMVRELSDDPKFSEEIAQRLQHRVLIDHLIALRSANGFSQGDIAKAMECSQSRVSKLEQSYDHEIRVGDLATYSESLGLELAISFRKKGTTLADQVKLHTVAIRKILHQLRALSGDDEAMVNGLKHFCVELLLNTAWTVKEINEIFKKVSQHIPAVPAPVIISDEEDEERKHDLSQGEDALGCRVGAIT